LEVEEKEILTPFIHLPLVSTQALLQEPFNIPDKSLAAVLAAEDGMDLSVILTGRSATQNLMWLSVLDQYKQSIIGTLGDLRKLIPKRVVPTDGKLTMLNQLFHIDGYHFSKSQSDELLCIRNGTQESWSPYNLDDNSDSDDTNYFKKHPVVDQIRSRLCLLEEIARTGLSPYRKIIERREEVEPNLAVLKVIDKKLNQGISDHLYLQRTALLLTDLTYDMRIALCHFAGLALKDGPDAPDNVLLVKGLRTLPIELRMKIFAYVLSRYLYDNSRILDNERWRSVQLDMRPPVDDHLASAVLIPFYTARLLPYLSEIKTDEALKHCLIKIPYNHYNIIFFE
jgi:hypothetical protein